MGARPHSSRPSIVPNLPFDISTKNCTISAAGSNFLGNMPSYAALCFAVLTLSGLVRTDSAVFSQFIGATTASPPDPAISNGAFDFSLCTNFLHGLPALTGLDASASTQVQQQQVDGVCQFCTSLGQSRIDSCCPQATSSACFDQFGAKAAETAPASASATPIETSASDSSSSSDNGAVIAKVRLQCAIAVDADCCRIQISLPVPS